MAGERGSDAAAGRLSRALEHAASLSGADGAALMLLDGAQRLRAVGAATGEGMELEVVQEIAGAGPAFDCVADGVPVAVEDVRASAAGGGRWFARQVAPIRSVLSLPIRAYGTVAGSLNLYRYRPAPWAQDQVAAAQRLADVVAVLLEMLARQYGTPVRRPGTAGGPLPGSGAR